MRYVSILGSTGSIGTQALTVISKNPATLSISALAAYHNDQMLEEQIEYFKPAIAVLVDKQAADRLVRRYRGSTLILTGEEGLLAAATEKSTHIVLTALVGFAGLKPTIAAIENGKDIAFANKETLVAAGELVMKLAKRYNVRILPVDSEHSAIFQCLQGENTEKIRRIILTASGGPFRGFTAAQLVSVNVADCLHHPNWSMGRKITIDSSTLANKGLEVIEARWLFGVDYDQIEVTIHPQSIIHSMVEFIDGSVLAQLGQPDMRVPIQYALTYPERLVTDFPKLDFTSIGALTFESPDINTFSALNLAYLAGRSGGTLPCVYNAANEVAVYAFLNGKISYLDIPRVIKDTMSQHQSVMNPDITAIISCDSWARQSACQMIEHMAKAIKQC